MPLLCSMSMIAEVHFRQGGILNLQPADSGSRDEFTGGVDEHSL